MGLLDCCFSGRAGQAYHVEPTSNGETGGRGHDLKATQSHVQPSLLSAESASATPGRKSGVISYAQPDVSVACSSNAIMTTSAWNGINTTSTPSKPEHNNTPNTETVSNSDTLADLPGQSKSGGAEDMPRMSAPSELISDVSACCIHHCLLLWAQPCRCHLPACPCHFLLRPPAYPLPCPAD